jgi:hypothetical protein
MPWCRGFCRKEHHTVHTVSPCANVALSVGFALIAVIVACHLGNLESRQDELESPITFNAPEIAMRAVSLHFLLSFLCGADGCSSSSACQPDHSQAPRASS